MLDTVTMTVNPENRTIEIRGAIEIDFEMVDEMDLIGFSNGVVLRVSTHAKGFKIAPVELPDEIPVSIKETVIGRQVIDLATIPSTRWVMLNKEFARRS